MNLLEEELKIHSEILSILESGLYFSLEYKYLFESFGRDKLQVVSFGEEVRDINLMFLKKSLLNLKDIAKSFMILGYCRGSKEDYEGIPKLENLHERIFKNIINGCDYWLEEEVQKIVIESATIGDYISHIPFTLGEPEYKFPLKLLLNAQQQVYYFQRAGFARGIINRYQLIKHKDNILEGLNISADHLFSDFEIPNLEDINLNNFLEITQRALNQHNAVLLFIPDYIDKWGMYHKEIKVD